MDIDPGYGKGTEIQITPADFLDLDLLIPVDELDNGFHILFVRALDDRANWSTTFIRPFLKGNLQRDELQTIVLLEYFIDTDPGYGKATPIDFVADNELHLSQNLDLSEAEPGFHTAYIRAKDENGNWSQTYIRPFIKGSLQTDSLPVIEKVEYFIDEDPGFGSGIEIPLEIESHSIDLEFIVDMSGQDTGKHVFYTRAMDKSGNWSMVYNEDFLVCQSYEIKDTMEICNGDSILIGGVWRRNAGTYYDSLFTSPGCDSVIITTLTVAQNYEISADASICSGDSILLEGKSRKEAGIYYDNLQSAQGCDSVIITTLTINKTDETNVSIAICSNESILLGGLYRNTAGTYYDSLLNTIGCDSVIITTLTVNDSYELPVYAKICNGDSILLGGIYRKTAGTYYDSLQTKESCDSVIITSLGVTVIDTVVTQTDLILTASQTGVGYQWISCPTNSTITGATGQSFQPESTGEYRVSITSNGCSDTSSCHLVTITGISENLLPGYVRIYPNPATDKLIVELNRAVSGISIYKITDIIGCQVDNGRLNSGSNVIDLHALPSGVYFLSLEIESKIHIAKIIVSNR